MNEINLNQIIIDHPDCLTSGSKLRAILLDLYPSASKAIVNTLATMVGAGIADEIIRADEITDLDKARWHKKLEDDYGLSEKIVKQCVELFCRKMPLVKSAKPQPIMQSDPSDFEISNGVLIKYKGKSPVVYIPNGVKTIKAWAFMGRNDITRVNIPHSVIELRENAFSECRNLSEVLISEGVKSIGNSAFSGCSKLTNIILPSTITEIGERAFVGCPLKTIVYNGTATQWDGVYKGYRWAYNANAVRQISESEYIANRKAQKTDPVAEVKTPSANQYGEKQSYGDEYGTYYESRSLEDDEIESRTRYERSIGRDTYDDDNTDDEYDYSDDYDVSDSDYPDYYD